MTSRGAPHDSIIIPFPPYKQVTLRVTGSQNITLCQKIGIKSENPHSNLVCIFGFPLYSEWGWYKTPRAIYANRRLKRPLMCPVTVRHWPHLDLDIWASIFWNRVTLMIFPSAGFSYFVQIAGLLNAWAKGLHKTSTTAQVHGSIWCPRLCILFLGSRLPTGPSRCRVCGCLPVPLCMLPSLTSGRQVVFIK